MTKNMLESVGQRLNTDTLSVLQLGLPSRCFSFPLVSPMSPALSPPLGVCVCPHILVSSWEITRHSSFVLGRQPVSASLPSCVPSVEGMGDRRINLSFGLFE